MVKTLSIIIPAYNEESRITPCLEDINNNLDNINFQVQEVVVVSDGSKDKTIEVVKNWINTRATNKQIFKILSKNINQGKGSSVKEGFLYFNSDWVLYTDADGATPILEINKLSEYIDNFDVICGSRVLKEDGTLVDMTLKRRFIGFVFHTILEILGLAKIKDTQCGFKLFKKDIAKDIVRNQKCLNFSFDIEYLYLTRKKGCKIKEVPVCWTEIEGSKVNLILDSIKMLIEVLKIRLIYKYN